MSDKLAAEELQQRIATASPDELKLLCQELMAENLLQAARWQELLDVLEEAICVVDAEQRVVGWNRRAELLYGITAAEIIGQPIGKFFSNLMVTRAMDDGQLVREAYHNPCPGTHVLINAQPVRLNGRIVGGVSAERDITEVVNLNQQLSEAGNEVRSLREEIDKIQATADEFSAIYGHSPLVLEAVRVARRVAATNVSVMLRGESGSGKELFASAIHRASGRRGQFIAINCGAIPASLFESELFGYDSGSFTGADKKGKLGYLEQAHAGTLFLDEIGEMPKEMQVKLLRVLQEQRFHRVGGKSVHVDIRVIAATHRDLEAMIARGDFREDLYYRLNVVTIPLPSLRERREDIPELVHRGIQHFNHLHGKQIRRLEPAVMATLLGYEWPGNVRELYNALERMVILCDGEVLTLANLPLNLAVESTAGVSGTASQPQSRPAAGQSLTDTTEAMERELIGRVLAEVNFNKLLAAKKLGIPRSTLYYKMKTLQLDVEESTKVSKN
jgi:PAS domain S-box-containing protein